MKKKNKAIYLLFLMPFVYFATACFVVWLVKTSGIYPSGSDTMYHVYRGDYVYNAIKSGNWYPLYDPAWYNGVVAGAKPCVAVECKNSSAPLEILTKIFGVQ